MIDDKLGFLNGFTDVGRLGEEVNAGIQPGGRSTGQIGLKPGIQKEPAFGVAAITQTNIGKVQDLGCGIPVDLPLVLGGVDADPSTVRKSFGVSVLTGTFSKGVIQTMSNPSFR